ncbi:Pfs, NACHT and ankyrin domain protein [Aspergillus ambiguus]|uniref:Pfs, NACHT and ankyrin domain protein n=1 Tax=Aspergillus ambiguus TaxID=176160 RepID=UPI003CCCCA67
MPPLEALKSRDLYTVGWIAALPLERAAATAILDDRHEKPLDFVQPRNDPNSYTWGRIGEHNVVIASPAAGKYGTISAAETALPMVSSFSQIRIGLLVGIGAGIANPDGGRDIRLGDVAVSQPTGSDGGVIQYDLFKATSGNQRENRAFLNSPPEILLRALGNLQAQHILEPPRLIEYLEEMITCYPRLAKQGYVHQGHENDRLFKTTDPTEEIQREKRDSTEPTIHYGVIASGNTLFKDAVHRDRIVADVGKECICFEMEAAGLMNAFPCIVIRGICDYADSHKNDRWQCYAAATAAAYAKELLTYVPTAEIQEAKRAVECIEVLRSVQQQLESVQQTTVAAKATADSIRSGLLTDKIRRWLHPPDPSTNANQARELRHEGTGVWLLESPTFQSWHAGSHRQLWLHGLAGCGKTVLSTTVLDYLAKADNGLVLSFFFDFSDTTKQTLDGMLRSLTFQLYQSGVGSAIHLDESFRAHRDGNDQPATTLLSAITFKMLNIQRRVTIVLDALDESNPRLDILKWIENVAELTHVWLLYTSRPESDLLRRIPPLIGNSNCLALDKKSINSDIRSWVTAQLSQRNDFTEKPLAQDLLQEIQRKVGDGADGMFRWAFCQLNSLAECPHQIAMAEALASLPPDLKETYRRMLGSIPVKRKNDAIRLLQFLVHSMRPLTLAEAKEVIATQVENEPKGFDTRRRLFRDTDILDYCPGLVTVVHDTKELHLAHFSVKEYLLGETHFEITTASISITKTCLAYMTDIDDPYQDISIVQKFPMAEYAAVHWPYHSVLAQASDDIVQITARFLEEEATFQQWCQSHLVPVNWDCPGPPRGPRIHYACITGLLKTAIVLIDRGVDVNAQGGKYGSALQAASVDGDQEIVQLLLDKGANVNAQGGKYGNALQAALVGDHKKIVQLLLYNGANVNSQGGKYGNALQAASVGGHREIVQLLLDNGADVNAQGWSIW